ncbi:MAG: hypothetical protein LIP11_09500, partial [Clostridiales bacterium]|nr:hypothetical protein [Clostridiales bacterium]
SQGWFLLPKISALTSEDGSEDGNTGLVIKRLWTSEGQYVQVVLKICTTEDEPGYKNSIISCWEISEGRLQNYLRNKSILYKRE